MLGEIIESIRRIIDAIRQRAKAEADARHAANVADAEAKLKTTADAETVLKDKP